DRIVLGADQRTRLVDSLETALKLGQGSVLLVPVDGGEERLMSQNFSCAYDGTSVPEPEPRNFSFNTPHGACPTCTGLGTRLVADADLVVPDPSLPLAEGAIAPWATSNFFYPEMLEAVCRHYKIGLRLKPESLAVTIADRNIAETSQLSVAAAIDWFGDLELSERESLIARGILKEIKERLQFLIDVGLEYLTIDRAANSLSGGESQ